MLCGPRLRGPRSDGARLTWARRVRHCTTGMSSRFITATQGVHNGELHRSRHQGTAREDRRRYARRKKALDEANGDQQKAAEIIRVKGLKGITKREGRATAEGLVAARVENGVGYMIEVNSETDFVAKSDPLHRFRPERARGCYCC